MPNLDTYRELFKDPEKHVSFSTFYYRCVFRNMKPELAIKKASREGLKTIWQKLYADEKKHVRYPQFVKNVECGEPYRIAIQRKKIVRPKVELIGKQVGNFLVLSVSNDNMLRVICKCGNVSEYDEKFLANNKYAKCCKKCSINHKRPTVKNIFF